MHLLELLVGLTGAFGLTLAQSTTGAKCSPTATQFNWMYNSLGQDPCTVASYLGGACTNGVFNIPPLNSTEEYIGPTALGATPCRCSTVFFNVLSACAVCQLAQTSMWSSYDANCTSGVYSTVFPKPIPAGTAVPHWAYLDITQYGSFNATVAEGLGDSPESTPVGSATSAFTTTTSSSGSSPPSSSTASHKSSNVGAIAGGVVGGIVFVALVAGVIFFFLNRTRYPAPSQANAPGTQPIYEKPMDYQPFPASPSQRPLIYDPADPRTFPTTPLPLPVPTPAPTTTSGTQTTASAHGPTGGPYYPGVAEV